MSGQHVSLRLKRQALTGPVGVDRLPFGRFACGWFVGRLTVGLDIMKVGSLGAQYIGYTHRGQLHAIKLVARKSNRNAEYGTEHAGIPQDRPERLAFAQTPDLGF